MGTSPARHCSCSVHILFPPVIHRRGCVIKISSRNGRTLIYAERKSRRRNQNKSLPFVENHAKKGDIEQRASTAILVFLLFSRHDKTQLRGKAATRKNHTLPKHRCPYPECEYETEDVKDELADVLLTVHSNGTHVQTTSQPATQATAKVEKVRRPTISSAGSSQKDYAEATKLKGKDMVIQLLECCEEQLRGTQAVRSPTNPWTR